MVHSKRSIVSACKRRGRVNFVTRRACAATISALSILLLAQSFAPANAAEADWGNNSTLGTGLKDQSVDSNTDVRTSLLGTTLDSTIADPRANPNEDLPPPPPRERGNIAEDRSGRTDIPERAQPIMR